MTLNFGDWKLKLIGEIMQLNQEQSLRKIEEAIKTLSEAEKRTAQLKKIIKPVRSSISVQDMVQAQKYKPIKKQTFYKNVVQLNIEEPLEDLLSM